MGFNRRRSDRSRPVGRHTRDPRRVIAEEGDSKEKKSGELLLTRIGDLDFASLEDGENQYLFFKYAIDDHDILRVWAPDTDFFAAAVESKQLNGAIKRSLFRSIIIDESPEKLRAFLEQQSAKCFNQGPPSSAKRIGTVED